MNRNEFGAGVLVGGLIGLAVGYLLRRGLRDQADEATAPETIDLTPALQRRAAVAGGAGDAVEASE